MANRKPSRSRGETKKKPITAKRVGIWALISFGALALVGVVAALVFYVTTPIPNPNKDFRTENTQLYFNDGTTSLGTLAVQNRTEIPLDQMPADLKNAIVAAENPTFWKDPGISLPGMMRALTTIGSKDTQGGSTITQQYVKVLYLTQERTLTRKAKEIVIAYKIGQDMSKEQVLEGYLNTVYYGRGAYGIQAASQAYFGKNASELDLQQSIVLSAVINAPGYLDPTIGPKNAQALLERYQYTINQMIESGKLTQEDKQKIYWKLPDVPKYKQDSRFGGTNGYLMKVTMDELKKSGFDDAQINGGGLTVITTIDQTKQNAAVATVQGTVKTIANERKKDPSNLHGSLVSIDNATGGVLAMYGGNDDYVKNQRNWATTARPTGSTFKTWVLIAALREGMSLDTPLKGYSFTPPGEKAPVSGSSGGGMITLRDATTNSVNSAYVDLTLQLKGGSQGAITAANDAGIPQGEGWDLGSRIAMGVAEVSPVDAAAGYSTLANGGQQRPWHIVSVVKDKTGKVIYEAPNRATQAIDSEIANAATDCLKAVATSGTGRTVGALRYPVAGKTGTRYDGKETKASWFVGYTKQITTAVNFVAGDSGSDNLEDYTRGFYGGGYPASTWLTYMKTAMQGLPKVDFDKSTYRATNTPSVIPEPQIETATPEPDNTSGSTPSPTKDATPKPSTQPSASVKPTGRPVPTKAKT